MVATDAQLATDQAYLTIDMCSNGRVPQSTSDDNHGSDGPVPRTSSTIARDSVLLCFCRNNNRRRTGTVGWLAAMLPTVPTFLRPVGAGHECGRTCIRVRLTREGIFSTYPTRRHEATARYIDGG